MQIQRIFNTKARIHIALRLFFRQQIFSLYCNATLVIDKYLPLLHSEWPKLYRVLAMLTAIGLNMF